MFGNFTFNFIILKFKACKSCIKYVYDSTKIDYILVTILNFAKSWIWRNKKKREKRNFLCFEYIKILSQNV